MNEQTIRAFLMDIPRQRLERFVEYHNANPQVWKQFNRQSLAMLNKCQVLGLKPKFGAKAVFEIIRWQTMERIGKDGWKANNNFAPLYARLLMEVDPKFENFFNVKSLKSETKDAVCHEGTVYAS